jgi:DNA-3-methyladenine glycosylase
VPSSFSTSAPDPARLLRGLCQPADKAAPWLLGKILVRRRGRSVVAARIVETEAYLGERDPAAHTYRGRTARNAPVFGPPGTVYVYFVYGMHHCLNISVDEDGVPGCVLIRAAEILDVDEKHALDGRGPGRLCRALSLDTRMSGRYLFEPRAPLTLVEGPRPRRVSVSPRIGITKAAERPLRFFDENSLAVSRAPRR